MLCASDGECVSGLRRTGADLTNKYCFSADLDCAVENHDGAKFDDVLRNKFGQLVVCSETWGWTWTDSKNGIVSNVNVNCQSGYCGYGPGTTAKCCFGADLNCTGPKGAGFKYGAVAVAFGKRYKCDQKAGGWQELLQDPDPDPEEINPYKSGVALICYNAVLDTTGRSEFWGEGKDCDAARASGAADANKVGCKSMGQSWNDLDRETIRTLRFPKS